LLEDIEIEESPMERLNVTLGIVGGSGMLGKAIARGLVKSGAVDAERLWVSNRTGARAGFTDMPSVTTTSDNVSLAGASDVILLCVPPAMAGEIGISVPNKLVISVMAGVSLGRLADLTGASRVVRAMTSPAAEMRLAFSPWIASGKVSDKDKALVTALLSAVGTEAEVADEGVIELFTAMTGPVPGFVAFFADCMAQYAVARGVAPDTADRAVRQLFLASGRMLAEGAATPADHVREMIDYAGTTAAGLEAMRASGIADDIARGLDAAVARTRTME
jgi:pyrroline-5-carboxylate reductase